MRIAIDAVSANHVGGFKTYNTNILKRLILENDNNKYYVFINEGSNDYFISSSDNIQVISISNIFSKTIPRLFWMQAILPLYLIKEKINVLFSPMNIMPIILMVLKIRKVLVIHSNLPWLYPSAVPGSKIKLLLQKFFTNISIKIANSIIVNSKTAKRELTNIFPHINSKTKTIYLGVDSDTFRCNQDINVEYHIIDKIDINNELYFLTISSAVRYHCLKELIIAYEKICDQYNDIPKYCLVSKNLDSKYFNEIKTIIDKSIYSEKIVFFEGIDSNYIPNLYKNSSLYIFSSYCEVFGLTNLEAMFCGVPVITSNKSAMLEICGDAAIYFDPFDTDDIKNKIISLYYNESKKNEMINNGYSHVKKYTWEKTFAETKKIIFV